MKRLGYIIFIVFFISFLIVFTRITMPFNIADGNIESGSIRLDSELLRKGDIIKLNGFWEFYWKNYIESDNGYMESHSDQYVFVPESWSNESFGEESYPGRGYGSYKTTIQLDSKAVKQLGIRIEAVYTSYRVYWNSNLITSVGKAGTSKEQTESAYRTMQLNFEDIKDMNELVIEVANFEQKSGGIWGNIYVGDYASLVDMQVKKTALEFFFFGAMVMMGWYNLVLFLLRKDDKSSLMCALMVMSVAFRSLFMGERSILAVFPNIQWWLMAKCETLLFYVSVLFFIGFLYTIFAQFFNKKLLVLYMSIGILFCLSVILLPPRIFIYTLDYYQIFTIVGAVFSIYVVAKAVINKHEGSVVILIGILFIIAAATNDILYTRKLIDTGFYVSHAFLTFSFLQALVVAIRNTRVHEDSIYYANKTKVDSLTGLLNHMAIIEELSNIIDKDDMNESDTSIGMLDIDLFKLVNDNYGHQKGDEVLVKLSQLLISKTRNSDYIGRYGGEEFLLVFPKTDINAAYEVVERIRIAVEKLQFQEDLKITVSIGITDHSESLSVQQMIGQADALLYEAKNNGRNQTKKVNVIN